MARGYGNHLKCNEVAKLKSDLMEVPQRWAGVAVDAIRERCISLGMADEDAHQIADLVTKAQAGRRLVPQPSYRGFRFALPPSASPAQLVARSSQARHVSAMLGGHSSPK